MTSNFFQCAVALLGLGLCKASHWYELTFNFCGQEGWVLLHVVKSLEVLGFLDGLGCLSRVRRIGDVLVLSLCEKDGNTLFGLSWKLKKVLV